ncbi:MAG: helix-turn-helix domain-containing protein [Sandaracinaceae bacterium]
MEGLDEARWRELIPILAEIAREVRGGDIADPDDVLGELAVAAYERWIPAYRRELATQTADASLHAYLRRRLQGRVAEMRRKAARRRELLAARGPRAEALLIQSTPSPFEEAWTGEVVAKATDDPGLRAVMALRLAGFTQPEIARALGVSRPTITRRVKVLAALVAALVGVGLVLGLWTRSGEPAQTRIVSEELPDAPVPRTAGGGDAPPVDDVPTERGAPEAPPPAPREAPPPSPRPTTPPLESDGREPDAVLELVMARRDALLGCVEGLDHAAQVDVTFDVDATGHVTALEMLHERRVPLYRCLRGVLGTLAFPVDRAGRYHVAFTLGPQPGSIAPTEPSDLEREAARCTSAGDNACVIRLLAPHGAARSPRALALLIEAHRARGQNAEALQRMRELIARFPNDPRVSGYRRVLDPPDRPPPTPARWRAPTGVDEDE